MKNIKVTLEARDSSGRVYTSSFSLSIPDVVETSGEEVPPSGPTSLPPTSVAQRHLQLVRAA